MQKEDKYVNSEELLKDVLNMAPGYSLPDSFANDLAVKLGKKYAWTQYLKEFLIYLGVFIAIAIIFASTSLFLYNADWREWLNFLIENVALIAGIGFVGIFVLFTDRVLLRYYLYKSTSGSI